MKRILLYTAFAALTLSSCIHDVVYELPDKDKFDNLYVVQAIDNPDIFKMKSSFDGTVTKSFSAYYSGMSAPKDIHITFDVDPSLVDSFNEETGGEYVLLPESAYEIPVKEATIKEGGCRTGLLEVKFHVSPDMDMSVEYVLPIKASVREKDIKVREELLTMYYVTGLTKDFSPIPVEGSVDLCDEIFSFNDKCIMAWKGATGELLRYPYEAGSNTIGEPTVIKNPSIDPYWVSSYARFIFPAQGSTIHMVNVYGSWIALQCSEDGTHVDNVEQYHMIMVGCSILLGCIPNHLSIGEMVIYMADGAIWNVELTADGCGFTGGWAYSNFNFWTYKLRFCYKDDVYGVDAAGMLWRHTFNTETRSFSTTPEAVGEGWGGFTHIIPFADDLLCRKSDGSVIRFEFDPQYYWDIKDTY